MFHYAPPFASPAIKSQLDAQISFAMDMSRKIFEGVQKINALNLQVMTTLLKESLSNTQQLLASTSRDNHLSIVAEPSPPATEKMRAYQQHLQNILAETQAGMTETFESHVPETVRATEEVANEVIQKVSEEAMKAIERQAQALEQLTTSIQITPNTTD